MPLFECDNCGVVDNTALGNFWEAQMERKPQLCTQCDPEIKKWHGRFERTLANDYRAKWPDSPIKYPKGSTTEKK